MFKFLPSLNYSFRISARNCSTKSTGIEHALNQKKLGARNKMDFQKDYKCIDYLNYSTFSFYDKEVNLNFLKKNEFIVL